jgi:hypothetical protein
VTPVTKNASERSGADETSTPLTHEWKSDSGVTAITPKLIITPASLTEWLTTFVGEMSICVTRTL